MKKHKEQIMQAVFFLAACASILAVALICLFLFINGIPAMKEMGITVAIGHSGADYDTSMRAIEKGAACCTHTFNAMKLLHQHFPEYSYSV